MKIINKSILIFLTVFFVHCSCVAQSNDTFIGKWKVIAVKDGVEYDYKTQKITITTALKDSLKGQTDSTDAIETLIYFVKMYGDYYFEFTKDGHYTEIRNGKARPTAKYAIDYINMAINLEYELPTLTGSKNRKMDYQLRNGFLELKIKGIQSAEAVFVLEKIINN